MRLRVERKEWQVRCVPGPEFATIWGALRRPALPEAPLWRRPTNKSAMQSPVRSTHVLVLRREPMFRLMRSTGRCLARPTRLLLVHYAILIEYCQYWYLAVQT